MSEPVLTRRELNRATLARQLLLVRHRLPVGRAVERLCALQAQYSPSPYLALWTRLDGFEREHLTRALERRQVVKATLFRLTLHLFSARDYLAFAGFWIAAQRMLFGSDLPRPTIEVLARQVDEAARNGRVTHNELYDLVRPTFGERLWRVRALAPLVHVPPSGTWRYHGRAELLHAERWLGRPTGDARAGSELLARRYLAAFGPATRDDLLRFAALRVRDVEPGLDALEPRLRRFRDERGRVLLDLAGAPRPAADTPAPVRFLPKWDALLLSHDDRTRVLPREYRDTVIRKNGDVLPTVLVDGHVAGVWREEKGRVAVEPFAPLPHAVRRELEDEARRLERFLGD
jgi:hypothetical protein